MLRVYGDLIELVREAGPLGRRLAAHDRDLARQFRRALASAPLNVAEGGYNRGGTRAARYDTAAGSLREAMACLEVGQALGYIDSVDARLLDRFDHIIAILMRNVARH